MNKDRSILLIDDEDNILTSLSILLKREGFGNVSTCNSSLKVNEYIEKYEPKIVLLDISMPEKSGEEVLLEISNKHPDIIVIMLTAIFDIKVVVNCMKKGAFDYLEKPMSKDSILPVIKRAFEVENLRNENRLLNKIFLKQSENISKEFSNIISINKQMIRIFQYCEAIANTTCPILITGETGTGKELIAKVLYKLSKKRGSFIPINSAGLDSQMFADSLFGHIKGAYTGGDTNRLGAIQEAKGGTLFLDEITNLDEHSQVKLLRLLQEGEFNQLGSDRILKSQASIIAATNQDLYESTTFRKDLFFRFNTHTINIPPLRERKEDIPLLLNHFIAKSAKEMNKKEATYPPELINLLQSYSFPGNVRELESMVYNAMSVHKSKKLSIKVFEEYIVNKTGKIKEETPLNSVHSFPETLPTLKENSISLIEEALKRSGDNKRVAAKILGISTQALHQRLNKK